MSFREYVEHGWVLCSIREGEKRPRGDGWNKRENGITSPERADMLIGGGLLHAFSGTCALDIDNVELTRIWLKAHNIDLDGLMNADEAVQIVRGDNTRGKLIYKLPEPLPTKQIKSEDKTQMLFELRCGATTGNSAQDVLPPTIHPSGQAYAWKYNNELADWRNPPLLPKELHELWLSMVRRIEPAISAPRAENTTPKSMSLLRELVFQRDADCSEPEWWETGAIISKETDHSEDGYELFDEWSATGGSKYEGPEATRKKWDEIGSRPDQGANAATIGKLLQERVVDDAAFGAPVDQKQLDDVIAAAEAVQREKHRAMFRWYSADEVMEFPPPNWLVFSIFPESRDLLFIAGIPGAGKSFLALSVSLAVVRGVPWFGYDTKQGNVGYIAVEAFGTFNTRLRAYVKQNDLTAADIEGFRLLGAGVHLGDKDQLAALAESAREFAPKLIVIDTLAAAAGGIDHKPSDMQSVIDGAKLLQRETGGTILIVAHHGKDESKGIMGWQGVTAAAETIGAIKESDDPKDPRRSFRIAKQRNGIEGVPYLWQLEQIDLGNDSKGQPVLGAAVSFLGIAKENEVKLPQGKWHKAVREALAAAPNSELEVEALVTAAKARVPEGQRTLNPRKQLVRALGDMVELGELLEPALAGQGPQTYRFAVSTTIGGNPDAVDTDADIL